MCALHVYACLCVDFSLCASCVSLCVCMSVCGFSLCVDFLSVSLCVCACSVFFFWNLFFSLSLFWLFCPVLLWSVSMYFSVCFLKTEKESMTLDWWTGGKDLGGDEKD